jgi:hypothetical protein
MKPKKIDLNSWERVDEQEDLEGYNGLIIVPQKLEDGTQLPPLYFIREAAKQYIEDITNAVWTKNCEISNKGEQSEYSKRVDWWVKNALDDEEYRTTLNETFNKHGFNLKLSWDKAFITLKGMIPSSRKTYLHKYIWKWLTRGIQWQINRIEKGKV